jgi:hypothetical protein
MMRTMMRTMTMTMPMPNSETLLPRPRKKKYYQGQIDSSPQHKYTTYCLPPGRITYHYSTRYLSVKFQIMPAHHSSIAIPEPLHLSSSEDLDAFRFPLSPGLASRLLSLVAPRHPYPQLTRLVANITHTSHLSLADSIIPPLLINPLNPPNTYITLLLQRRSSSARLGI